MTQGDDATRESRQDEDYPKLLEEVALGTQTIDLHHLLSEDVTESGSFDMGGIQKTSLGKLLEALPIPAVLLDYSLSVLFTNRACGKFHPNPRTLWLDNFSEVLKRPGDSLKIQDCLAKLTEERRAQVAEAIIGVGNRRIWGRIYMRSLRVGPDRFILVMIEDLTAEKKQTVITNKYAKILRESNDELEIRVKNRTRELAAANEELRREITARQNAQESLNLAANVIASSNEAIMVTDAAAKIVEVNEAFCKTTGYSREDVMGRSPNVMGSGRHDKHFWRDFWHVLSVTGQWKGEVWDRRKNGEIYPKLLSVSTVKDKDGNVSNYVGIFSDITKMKQTEQRLEHLAHYDPLTELPNRLLLRDRLHRAIIRAERDKKSVALMFLDLDGFKTINDTVGHSLGDELLVQVAERLLECVRKGDTVARLGGDEFTIVAPDIAGGKDVVVLAERIIDSLSKPFNLKGGEVFSSGSIGIGIYPNDGTDVDRLLQNADTAMYHAKSQGKNNFQFFSRAMNLELTWAIEMETTLRRATENKGLIVYYQPVVSCQTGEIVGMEALLRLKDARGEVISAGPYIPVAEEKGLIVPIGEWVLRTACLQAKLWQEAGFAGLPVAVNMSMRQLRQHGIVKTILNVLRETRLDPSLLTLELTESAVMADVDHTTGILKGLRERGVSVSIDDFGTGYSSLSYLRHLPVSRVKVDKSFVEDFAFDRAQRALVQAVVTVAHSLNMTVVAEGIEQESQLQTLLDLDCDAWQGYYFSPAISGEDFGEILRSGKTCSQRLVP